MSRQARWYTLLGLVFFIVLEALLAAAIVWWPSFAENVKTLKTMAAPLPWLREQIELMESTGVSGYVVGQHYFKACNTLGAAAAVLFAINAVAGEAHRGTLEIWMGRPVSRTRITTERYVGGLLAIVVPVFLSSATIPALLATVDATMTYGELALCSIHSSLFLACIYTTTFLWSAMDSQPLKIAVGMLFFSVFQFSIYVVKTITHYSLFRIVDLEQFIRITIDDELKVWIELGMVGYCAAVYAGALWVVHRRVP
ncbi:MAG: ABC transporter permease [Planctomycetota bacterium]|nr:MAG: ABC transporter permease [Planctomycetota bacterium]